MFVRNGLKSAFATGVLSAAICSANPLDTTFGRIPGDTDALPGNVQIGADVIVADASGNLYVAGMMTNGNTFVYSQTSSGAERPGYGRSSEATNSKFAGYESNVTSATVDSQGRVLVAGYVTLPLSRCPDGSSNSSYAFVERFTVGGTLDTTFGIAGSFAGSSLVLIPCAKVSNTFISIQSTGKLSLVLPHRPTARVRATFSWHGSLPMVSLMISLGAVEQ